MAANVDIQLKLVTSQINRGLRQVDSSVRKVNKSLSFANLSLASFAGNLATRGFASFIFTIRNGIGDILNSAIAIEKVSTQFKVLIGDSLQAKKALETVSKFASTTPFTNPEVERASKTLLSFGVTTETLLPVLKNLGDIAAASGSSFEEIALIFGQVSAAGKLTGERLLQLQERGIAIGPALANVLGVSVSEVRDKVSQGAASVETFTKALQSLSQKGGPAFQGIAALSKTLGGSLSTLESNFELIRRSIGSSFTPAITKAVNTLNKFITTNQSEITNLALKIAGGFGRAVISILQSVQTLVRNINPIVGTFRAISNSVKFLFVGISIIINTVLTAITERMFRFISFAAVLVNSINNNFDKLVPDKLATGLAKATASLKEFEIATKGSLESLSQDAFESTNNLKNSFKEVISKRTVEEVNNNLKALEGSIGVFTKGVDQKLKGMGQSENVEESPMVKMARTESEALTKQERETQAKLFQIRQESKANMAIMVQEDQIAKIESNIINNETEVSAVRLHEDKIAAIRRDNALKIASQTSDDDQRKIQTAQAQAKFEVDIERNKFNEMKRLRDVDKKSQQGYQQATDDIIQAGLTVAKKGSIERKAFAIAEATINTYRSANLALATYPPPASFIAASAAVIKGLANVSKITSQGNFRQGGVVPSGFPGDSFRANLSSNEVILNPRQAANTLFNLSQSRMGNDNNKSVIAELREIKNALMSPTTLENANSETIGLLVRDYLEDNGVIAR
ncbi:viral A-type inclusion protein [uncultured Mediterranean phage uvMED]|nr:viral A-type inclusion protein [uncultured Mediterranean phage uvMED]